MYFDGQTLYHKKNKTLARLAVSSDGKFPAIPVKRDQQNYMGMVAEDGTKFWAKYSDYTNISDEWGNPYCKPIKKGEHVDTSGRKYVVATKEELATMRQNKLKVIRDNAKKFCDLLMVLINVDAKSEHVIGNGEDGQFSANTYGFDMGVQFFTPKVNNKFNFISYFTLHLWNNGWRVTLAERTGFNNKKFITSFTATKKGEPSIYWTHSHDSSLNRVKVKILG